MIAVVEFPFELLDLILGVNRLEITAANVALLFRKAALELLRERDVVFLALRSGLLL